VEPPQVTSRTLKITLAYEGTHYVGWQRQANGTSVQGVVEAALCQIVGAKVSVMGAGRTDAGVHAVGQVASAIVHHGIEAWQLRRALNGMLPRDVRVVGVEDAPHDFHARFSTSRKTYAYRIALGPVVNPLERAFVWHHPGPLNPTTMATALALLVGEHDFSAFQGAGAEVTSTTRCLFDARLDVLTHADLRSLPRVDDADHLVIRLTADGFLRHMVRTVVGTLVEVGRGRRPADEIKEVLASRDRQRAGQTAPAAGLVLERVEYAGDVAGGLPRRHANAKIRNHD
jgi:tRNA pseudouridine38-40 synthase